MLYISFFLFYGDVYTHGVQKVKPKSPAMYYIK